MAEELDNESEVTTAAEVEDDKSKKDPYAEILEGEPTKESVAALVERLKAVNGEAASYRHQLKELKTATEGEAEKALREATESGEKTASDKYESIIIKASARSALTAAGATGNIDKLMNLLDTESVSVSEDGSVDGLDKAIEEVKKDFPSLFKVEDDKSKKVRRVTTSADGGDKTTVTEKKSSAQLHAERVLGNG